MIKIAEHDLGGCYVLTDTQNRFNRLDVSYEELKAITKELKSFVEDLEKRKKRAALFKPMEELMYA